MTFSGRDHRLTVGPVLRHPFVLCEQRLVDIEFEHGVTVYTLVLVEPSRSDEHASLPAESWPRPGVVAEAVPDDLARAVRAVVDEHLDPVCVLASAQAANIADNDPELADYLRIDERAFESVYSSSVAARKKVVDESRKCPMCGHTTWVLLDGHSTLQALEGGLEALAYSCENCGFIRWHRMDKTARTA